MKKTALTWLSFAFIVAATVLGACGRAHLSSNYGQAYGAWFMAQHVKSKGTPADARKVIESLDAQEAASVSKNYRKGVSKGGDDAGSRMLMIGPSRAGGETYMPPPSVPGQ